MNLKRKERIKNGLLKTGELAKKANLLPSCIRYYTKLGLLEYCAKTQGNFRLYDVNDAMKKIGIIKSLKEQGVYLDVIREKLKGYK